MFFWSDSAIPGHLLTYPSTLLRTKHMETKVTIQIQWDVNEWSGILQSSRSFYEPKRNYSSSNKLIYDMVSVSVEHRLQTEGKLHTVDQAS